MLVRKRSMLVSCPSKPPFATPGESMLHPTKRTRVPGRKGGYPGWLHGPLANLDLGIDPRGIVLLIGAMWVFYLLALAVSRSISTRGAITAIVAVHLVFLLGPPLLSTDVFNYVEYG